MISKLVFATFAIMVFAVLCALLVATVVISYYPGSSMTLANSTYHMLIVVPKLSSDMAAGSNSIGSSGDSVNSGIVPAQTSDCPAAGLSRNEDNQCVSIKIKCPNGFSHRNFETGTCFKIKVPAGD